MSNTFKEEQEKWEEDTLSPLAKKSKFSKRWVSEDIDPYRTEYQRDFGRILYSNEFRRLRLKTQVFAASSMDQHDRTRLTHTLEVSQIARSISRPLKLNVDLTEAIALGHDLGHTPFGHAGERALNACLMKTGKKFSHNSQSVWVVERLLHSRKDCNGNYIPGLNLTYDVIEGIWKHTNIGEPEYEFDQLNKLNPSSPASLEGQVVEIADRIAYLKHDTDDAIRNHIIDKSDIENLWGEYIDIPFCDNWIHILIYDVIKNSMNKTKIAFSNEMENLYNNLKKFCTNEIIKSPIVQSADNKGIEIVTFLYNYYYKNPDKLINRNTKINYYKYEKFGIERMITDYIQWLGDEMAESEYNTLINY